MRPFHRMLTVLAAVGFGCLLLLSAWLYTRPPEASIVIEVAGSTSVTPLLEYMATRYSRIKPGVDVRVSGTGSSDGVQAATTGSSDLGMTSRALRGRERDANLKEHVIALDAIVVVVHPSNAINDLTFDQVRQIFRGEITSWSQLGSVDAPIVVVSREPGSGTRGAFEQAARFAGELRNGAYELDGTGAVKAAVAGNPHAVGYISLGFLDQYIQPVSIDSVRATPLTIASHTYPVIRPFIVLEPVDGLSPAAAVFLEWMLSPEGQSVAATRWAAVQ